jgi:hypothetical protein
MGKRFWEQLNTATLSIYGIVNREIKFWIIIFQFDFVGNLHWEDVENSLGDHLFPSQRCNHTEFSSLKIIWMKQIRISMLKIICTKTNSTFIKKKLFKKNLFLKKTSYKQNQFFFVFVWLLKVAQFLANWREILINVDLKKLSNYPNRFSCSFEFYLINFLMIFWRTERFDFSNFPSFKI